MPAFPRRAAILVPLALTLLAATDPTACRLIRGQSTTDTADDVSVCRSDVWIHQAGEKLGNLAALGGSAYPGWNGTKPTASFEDGAGAATVTHWVPSLTDPNHAPTSFIVEGKVTGNLDNLAGTLYLVTPLDQHYWGAFYPHFQLTVDGQVAYEAGPGNDFYIPITPLNEGIAEIRFVLTGLYDVIAQANDPDKDHTVRLLVRGWTYGDEAVFVYDAAEVPAGIVFNIDKLGGYTEFAAG